jgi:hypothetical protein
MVTPGPESLSSNDQDATAPGVAATLSVTGTVTEALPLAEISMVPLKTPGGRPSVLTDTLSTVGPTPFERLMLSHGTAGWTVALQLRSPIPVI